MIRFDDVTVTYDGAAPRPCSRIVDLHVPRASSCSSGRTGTGKSTLLRCVNGLVPTSPAARSPGRVTVTQAATPACTRRGELADVVGVVPQDPLSGFVTDMVEDELAYGMESIGLAPDVMRRRVEETLDLLGLADLRNRPLRSCRGGQRQRVAIGAVLTMHLKVLVLDEPTSALDPGAAEEVLAALQRLVHDLGVTVLLAEHRLERVVQYADRVVVVPGAGEPLVVGTPAEVMATAVRRRSSSSAARRLVAAAAVGARRRRAAAAARAPRASARRRPRKRTRSAIHVVGDDRPVGVRRRGAPRLRCPPFRGITPPPTAARSSRSWPQRAASRRCSAPSSACTCRPPVSCRRRLDLPSSLRGRDLVTASASCRRSRPTCSSPTAWATRCTAADRDGGAAPGTTRALLDRLAPGIADDMHPRDLSEGQRLARAVRVVPRERAAGAAPRRADRGLDYAIKQRLVTTLRDLAAQGHCVVLATHDVELAAG